jgi:hypothetical protein
LDAPIFKLSEESFGYTAAVEPGDGFDIENSALDGITGDLFISPCSSGHIFIKTEGSGELELTQDF